MLGTETRTARHGNDREVGPQEPVRAEVAAEVLRRTRDRHDEDPCVPSDRRQRRAAALEDQEPGITFDAATRDGGLDVAGERRAGETAARAAGADRGHARGHRVLEVVRGRVLPRAHQADQRVEVARCRPRPPAARRDRPGPSRRRSGARPRCGGHARDLARRSRSCPCACPCRTPRASGTPSGAGRSSAAGRTGSRRRRTAPPGPAPPPRPPSARGTRAPARRTGRAPTSGRSSSIAAARAPARSPPAGPYGDADLGQLAGGRASRPRPSARRQRRRTRASARRRSPTG